MSILDNAIQDMVKDLESVKKRIERHVADQHWKKPGAKQYAQIEAQLNSDARTGKVLKNGEAIGTFSLSVDSEKAKVEFEYYSFVK